MDFFSNLYQLQVRRCRYSEANSKSIRALRLLRYIKCSTDWLCKWPQTWHLWGCGGEENNEQMLSVMDNPGHPLHYHLDREFLWRTGSASLSPGTGNLSCPKHFVSTTPHLCLTKNSQNSPLYSFCLNQTLFCIFNNFILYMSLNSYSTSLHFQQLQQICKLV